MHACAGMPNLVAGSDPNRRHSHHCRALGDFPLYDVGERASRRKGSQQADPRSLAFDSLVPSLACPILSGTPKRLVPLEDEGVLGFGRAPSCTTADHQPMRLRHSLEEVDTAPLRVLRRRRCGSDVVLQLPFSPGLCLLRAPPCTTFRAAPRVGQVADSDCTAISRPPLPSARSHPHSRSPGKNSILLRRYGLLRVWVFPFGFVSLCSAALAQSRDGGTVMRHNAKKKKEVGMSHESAKRSETSDAQSCYSTTEACSVYPFRPCPVISECMFSS